MREANVDGLRAVATNKFSPCDILQACVHLARAPKTRFDSRTPNFRLEEL